VAKTDTGTHTDRGAATPVPPAGLPAAGERRERADAARNRERILAAARRLIGENGVRHVSLEQIAAEAGVGRATLFRRFPDRASLLRALLDEHERRLQDAILAGPPPLGPGAPAARRLMAFAEALLDLTVEHREFLLGAETTEPLARLRTGAYAAWHLHVGALLAETRPGADPAVLADLVLGLYDAELQDHLHAQRDPEATRELVLDSVRRLAGVRRPRR
jgi:AcrR family transcriptional regulator